MSTELRIVLIVVSILVLIYVLRKIRQSKLNIIDSIFWIVVAVILILLSVFPQIAFFLSAVLGIQTPLNFIFLLIIAILILKVFLMTIKISQLQEKTKVLAQKIAYDEFEKKIEDTKEEDQ
ncbi:MAG: DUF2304 domain-containing protein [Christensenellaceae bacterium]